jgi:hypothetical protein
MRGGWHRSRAMMGLKPKDCILCFQEWLPHDLRRMVTRPKVSGIEALSPANRLPTACQPLHSQGSILAHVAALRQTALPGAQQG